MVDNVEDVKKPDPSTGGEEIIEEVLQTPLEGEIEGQTAPAETTPASGVKEEVKSPVDDREDKNLFWETKRKVDELYPMIKGMQESIQNLGQQGQAQTQPQYSKAQLRAYLSKPELDDNTRMWAATELDSLEKKERTDSETRITESLRSQTQGETARRDAYGWVSQNFPNCFHKDATGNLTGWNEADPMTRKIGEYLQTHKELGNNPAGLMAAAKMAAYDLGVGMNKKLTDQVTSTTAQLRREQKKSLIPTGGTGTSQERQSSQEVKVNELLKELRHANTSRDRKSAVMKEILRLRGLNPMIQPVE